MENKQIKSPKRGTERVRLQHRVYEMRYVENACYSTIAKETGLCMKSVYNFLRIFETENPQIAEEMKKQGKDVTPEDYAKLKQEIASLKKELSTEKLRADFYEEMVAFGKEVYGIDLKKAGTK
jgi:DNA-binding transcriptional MerR regulator